MTCEIRLAKLTQSEKGHLEIGQGKKFHHF